MFPNLIVKTINHIYSMMQCVIYELLMFNGGLVTCNNIFTLDRLDIIVGSPKMRFSNSRVCLTRGKTMAPTLHFVDIFLLEEELDPAPYKPNGGVSVGNSNIEQFVLGGHIQLPDNGRGTMPYTQRLSCPSISIPCGGCL
jgi:hypothetical protein